MMAYLRSKTLAERAAWKFVSELPEGKRFELATVNPSGVMGPFLNSSDSGSGELVSTMLGGKMPMIANVGLPLVDIRDVVQAHIAAMTVPEAAGKRFAVNPIAAMMPEAARVYREAFAPYGYHVPSLVAPKPLLWLASWFDDTAGIAFTIAGRPPATNDNENARTLLGLPLITDPAPCLLAMGFSMIRHGMLPDKSEGHVLTRALRPDTSGRELPPHVADVREAMDAVMAPFAMPSVVQGLRRADGSVSGADIDLPGRVGIVTGADMSPAAETGL